MATVTSYTAARMQAIEDSAVVGGHITGDNLILERFDGSEFTAGDVRGPAGPIGPAGSVSGALGSTDNAILRTDGVGGTLAQGSAVTIDDSGRLTASLMSVTTAPSVDDDVVNKAALDKSGRGLLGLSEYSASDEALTASTYRTLTPSVTFTPVTNRYYRFTAIASILSPSSAGGIVLALFRSTDLTTELARVQHEIHDPTFPCILTLDRILKAPAGWSGSTTFVIRALCTASGSSVINTSSPSYLSIEDVGTL